MKRILLSALAAVTLLAGLAKAQEYTVTTPAINSSNFTQIALVPAYDPALDTSGKGKLVNVRITVTMKQTRSYVLRSTNATTGCSCTFDLTNSASYMVTTGSNMFVMGDSASFPFETLTAAPLTTSSNSHNYQMINSRLMRPFKEFTNPGGLVAFNLNAVSTGSINGQGPYSADLDYPTSFVIKVEYNPA